MWSISIIAIMKDISLLLLWTWDIPNFRVGGYKFGVGGDKRVWCFRVSFFAVCSVEERA